MVVVVVDVVVVVAIVELIVVRGGRERGGENCERIKGWKIIN
jgi:hypothetical protein